MIGTKENPKCSLTIMEQKLSLLTTRRNREDIFATQKMIEDREFPQTLTLKMIAKPYNTTTIPQLYPFPLYTYF